MDLMSTKPDRRKKGNKDRHGPGKMVRLPLNIHTQLAILAERNDRPLAWQIRRALIEHLQANGLWPPGTPSD